MGERFFSSFFLFQITIGGTRSLKTDFRMFTIAQHFSRYSKFETVYEHHTLPTCCVVFHYLHYCFLFVFFLNDWLKRIPVNAMRVRFILDLNLLSSFFLDKRIWKIFRFGLYVHFHHFQTRTYSNYKSRYLLSFSGL